MLTRYYTIAYELDFNWYFSLFLKVDRISTDIGRSGGPPPTSTPSSVSQGVSGRMTLRPYHPPQQTIYP